MSNEINPMAFFQEPSVADLRLLACPGAEELTKLIDQHLVEWAKSAGVEKDSFIIPCECPRFQSGDAKGLVRESVRGDDIFIVIDPGNYSVTYNLFGYENHLSPDDHFANLKRLIHDGEELTIFSVKQEDLKGFQMEAKRYGVLFYPIVNKVEKTGTVEIMAKARDAKQINRIFERMGYPAPVKEDTAAKKENARAPSENSSKERGTGARASTEPATEKADARPSVRSRLMALQAAAERDGTAPTKDTVREAIQKAMPTRE